jgi:dTDP-4-dehydrorhamnose 3,5-epimerase-like enzyme
MKVTPTAIPDVLLIEPRVFGDVRGFFYESFNQRAFANATGLDVDFVQDNHSRSQQGVLRGVPAFGRKQVADVGAARLCARFRCAIRSS